MNVDRDLYEETILEHNRHPFHYMETPPGSNRGGYGFNPVCGDEFTLHLRIEEGRIRAAGFEGVGCALSVASASMMTKVLEGMEVHEAEALFQRMTAFLHGQEDGVEELGELTLLAGVFDYPERIKCAVLAWHILHAALQGDRETVCTE